MLVMGNEDSLAAGFPVRQVPLPLFSSQSDSYSQCFRSGSGACGFVINRPFGFGSVNYESGSGSLPEFFIEDSNKHQKKISDVNACGEQRSKDVNVSWFLRFLTWLQVARTGERINECLGHLPSYFEINGTLSTGTVSFLGRSK
jgi:hypothetical protein